MGGERILRSRATLDVIWAGIHSLWHPFSSSIHSGRLPKGHLLCHHLPVLGSLIMSLAAQDGLMRFLSLSVETAWSSGTSEERARRGLEAGSWWEETNSQLEGRLPPGKGIWVVPMLSWSWPMVASSSLWDRMWSLKSESLGASCHLPLAGVWP